MMGLSKSHRIILLLIIDTIFFVIELGVGYAVHSLALVADSFHMLNDVLSLCVGLWAVKIANQKMRSGVYTYGWQRAETLGALVNGVFLVALCMSIFLEAIQRLVEPQEVRNPKLVLIVGSLGLASNLVGLALFHDHTHGHGHGQESHHSETTDEEQASGSPGQGDTAAVADESGRVAGVMPANALAACDSQEERQNSNSDTPRKSTPARRYSRRRGSRRRGSISRGYRDVDEIYTHPANLRQEIIEASRFEGEELEDDSEEGSVGGTAQPSERSPLLGNGNNHQGYSASNDSTSGKLGKPFDDDLHQNHNHARPKSEKKSGHSHDLNMRGVFLHVMGDALGNIGVIASALVIWLTDYSWRYYVDPGISLVITVIILCSAIPLCKAASRILLQAAPAGLSIDHIVEDIESLPGVVSCHHLHVWQLSNTNVVSSLHIHVSHDIKDEGSDRYMELARQIRRCLHAYGIHSSTIQPEFAPHSDSNSVSSSSASRRGNGSPGQRPDDAAACWLACGNDCAPGGQCCPSTK
ncbi:hypothetical protein VTO42DRAFT_2701 [Malbranchea cinnamomea]